MTTLALDVAMRHTGYSVFDGDGLIDFGYIPTVSPPDCDVTAGRAYSVANLVHAISNVINTHGVDHIVMELPTGTQSAGAISMMLAVYGVLGLAAGRDIPVHAIYPREVKKRVLFNSSADKKEVMAWARNGYPHANFPKAEYKFEHIADSILVYFASLSKSTHSEVRL